MMQFGVAGVGVVAPGLIGWNDASEVLCARAPYAPAPIPDLNALPAALRRRTSLGTRIAVAATLEAAAQSAIPIADLASVFGSGTGSGTEVHHMLTALAQPDLAVSPTHFHNSVHNAAVGYWCMTAASHCPSTSVTAHDDTFAGALLKAAAQIAEDPTPTVLTVFDAPFPDPLSASRPIVAPVSVSLVLVPSGHSATWSVEADLEWDVAESSNLLPAELSQLANGNPAGRALPLLSALAQGAARVDLPYLDGGRIRLRIWQR